ncbi:MAG: magnesium transporter [Candidatus Tokpelaia sp. JSC189]|nr:MAG: magnesium transporter [Candidatus Tokpelaia sp. JSC189]
MINHISDLSHSLPTSVEALAKRLSKLHYADAVDIVNRLEFDDAVHVFVYLPIEYAIKLFDKPELQRSAKILEALPNEHAVSILNGMSADEATDVFQEMDNQTRQRLFAQLQPVTRTELKNLTSYPQHSAGALMTTEFIAVPSNYTVQHTLDYICEVERTRETVYTTYIVAPGTSELLSAISLRRLILAKPDDNVLDAAQHIKPVIITALTDREEVARLFRRYDLLSVPVVNGDKQVIGLVTVDDVLDAMTEEMNENTHRFGGMETIDQPYMRTNFLDMLKKRSGWLSILFIAEMFTATALQFFEGELEKAIVLALFLPLITSSGGNSGSQATSLIIRALALREITLKDWRKVITRELPTGLALGAILGIIGFIRIAVWQYTGIYDYGPHWPLIAFTIFCTLVAVVGFGSFIGSILPFVMKMLGFDPASASAPFIATFVDVTGIIIYFSFAAILLAGTLL